VSHQGIGRIEVQKNTGYAVASLPRPERVFITGGDVAASQPRLYLDDVAVAMNAIPRPELPLYRLYLLRAMYAVLAFAQGYHTWSAILHHTGPWEFWEGVGRSFFGALTVLSLLGLRYPVRMIPLLLYEFTWKLIWTLAIYLPMGLSHRMDRDAADSFFSISSAVVIVPLLLPWGYIWKTYVTAPGDRWR